MVGPVIDYLCREPRKERNCDVGILARIKDGNAETLYPRSSIAVNCTCKVLLDISCIRQFLCLITDGELATELTIRIMDMLKMMNHGYRLSGWRHINVKDEISFNAIRQVIYTKGVADFVVANSDLRKASESLKRVAGAILAAHD